MPKNSAPEISGAAKRALIVGAAGFVLVGFNTTATNLAFGDITDTYSDVAETTVAFVSSGYLVGTAAFLPLAGRIADRQGRVRIFQLGVLLFGVTALASALAPNVWVLIAARVLQAIAGALVIPSSLSMVLPLYPEGKRSSAVASWAAAGPLSAAIAPSVSAGVLQISSWRWLYFLSAPVALIIWLIGRRTLRETAPPTGGPRMDLLGSAFGTASIAMVVFAVGKGKDWGWSSALTLGCFALALGSAVVFVIQSRRHPEPLIDLDLFRINEVWVANLANTLVSITSLSIWLVWPLYMARVWDYSPIQVGLGLTPGPLAAGLMTLAGGWVADRRGFKIPIKLGSLVMVFAVGWHLVMLRGGGQYVTHFLPGIVAFGTGWGFSSPTMNSWALHSVAEDAWGSMNAAFNMFRNVAGAVGVAAAVAFIGSADRPDLIPAFTRSLTFFFAFTIAAALVAIVLYPREAKVEEAGRTT